MKPRPLFALLVSGLSLMACQTYNFSPVTGASKDAGNGGAGSPGGPTGTGGGQSCGGSDFLSCDAGAPNAEGCVANDFTYCDGGAPPQPALCKAGGVNNESGILVGFAPGIGQTVGGSGQIKVWVNDEGAPIIAPGEQVDATTGSITTPGDRTARAGDGYLWEPALYIVPQSAEDGGTPHFPTAIRGSYNPTTTRGAGINIPGMDAPPSGSVLQQQYTGEFIWDVHALGLTPGTYTAEFVIHDGDRDRGVGCVSISVTR